MTRRAVCGLLLLTSAACRSAAPPVQMYGTPTTLERLAGRWSGEYLGDASHHRSGSIAFTLESGTHEARGDVLMVPDGGVPYHPYDPDDRMGLRPTRTTASQFLSIRFVEVERDVVRGRLDQYWDPERNSAANTEFVGRIGDDLIEGTFTTTYRSGNPSTGGQWSVRRARR